VLQKGQRDDREWAPDGELVETLGFTRLSKSQVSVLAAELDAPPTERRPVRGPRTGRPERGDRPHPAECRFCAGEVGRMQPCPS
jgi:hypothetical protein